MVISDLKNGSVAPVVAEVLSDLPNYKFKPSDNSMAAISLIGAIRELNNRSVEKRLVEIRDAEETSAFARLEIFKLLDYWHKQGSWVKDDNIDSMDLTL